MAATTCAYGYDSGLVPPSPAQAMDPFDDGGRGHHHHCPIIHDHYSIIHGVVMPPPPPPPPPPPLLHLHSGASSKAAASRHPGLCTEGLGSESSESSGDLDLDLGDIVADDIEDCKRQQQGHSDDREETLMPSRKRVFPPPISVIGAAGKPWQYLRAQRGGGRLVLREVRIPSRELLHACREDGRLKLHFAHPEPEEQHHLAHDQECNN